MRLELDDPRLMDYVLGELEDGDALDVAAALELDENKEARELVEELRGVADTARRILHEEDGEVALSDEQRAAIVGTVGEVKNVVQGPRWWFVRRVVVSAVACAVLVLGVAPLYWRTMEAKRAGESQRMAAIVQDQELVDKSYKISRLLNEGDAVPQRVLTEPLSEEERVKLRRDMDVLNHSVADSAMALSPEPTNRSTPESKPGLEKPDSDANLIVKDVLKGAAAQGAPPATADTDSEVAARFETYEPNSSETRDMTPDEIKANRVREHVKYAKLYSDQGLNAQAVEIYSHVLQLDPTNEVAKEGLHQASLAKAAEDPIEKQRQIEADSNKIRQYVEESKQLPEGADAKGIKQYVFRVPEIEEEQYDQEAPADGSNSYVNSLDTATDTGKSQDAYRYDMNQLSDPGKERERIPYREPREDLESLRFLNDGLAARTRDTSQLVEKKKPEPKPKPKPKPKPEPIPVEEQWAEYNVGNLTGQTELPTAIASNHEPEGVRSPAEPPNNLWQWNTPTDKPTEIVGGPGTETYVKVAGVKPFVAVKDEPLSTFSIDVDTAAYSNVRRFLSQGQLPPADAVRIEEMINYFAYSYPQPTDGRPFAVAVHGAPAPWAPERQLVRIGVKGKEVPQSERPQANLVFLLDVSGSMSDANKLPLVKESMKTLLSQLRPNDRVGIVTYAGDARLVLGSTSCGETATITTAIDGLQSGGSTNGGGGIQMAYDLAQSNFIKEGINRVVMATDGDFNVGTTEHGDLMGLIESRAKSGVFLTTLGFGMGNLKDSTLEQLADRGNGNYAYIDNHAEARKALVDQLSGTLQTIAKDVKIQVEFNPAKVSHYRLLGYENRALANQDFNDDTKDAGEIGAGHTVTALYEIIPVGASTVTGVDALKYQNSTPGDAAVEVQPGAPSVDALKYPAGAPAPGADELQPAQPGFGGEERFVPEPVPAGEWLTVKMRYKQPEGAESTKIDVPLLSVNGDLSETDADFRFASAVAAFGQVLRNSGYQHPSNFDRIIELARGAANGDAEREAFVDLVITAKTLCAQNR